MKFSLNPESNGAPTWLDKWLVETNKILASPMETEEPVVCYGECCVGREEDYEDDLWP